MNKYSKIYLFLIILLLLNGCARQNQLNLASNKTFVSSLKKNDLKEQEINQTPKNNLTIKDINKKEKDINKKENNKVELTLSSFENNLKKQIGSNEKLVNKRSFNPDLIIKHGKIKNSQFHFKSCYLDLFFLKISSDYILDHFELRSSNLSTIFDRKKCFKEIKEKFKLKHLPN